MAQLSKININGSIYEIKEQKEPVIIKEFRSPDFDKSLCKGEATFSVNISRPSGYKCIGIIEAQTHNGVFPINILYTETESKIDFKFWSFNPTRIDYPIANTFYISGKILYVRQ